VGGEILADVLRGGVCRARPEPGRGGEQAPRPTTTTRICQDGLLRSDGFQQPTSRHDGEIVSPPQSSGAMSCIVSLNVHWWPAKSWAVYWRSP
jgi:hypothetical protein